MIASVLEQQAEPASQSGPKVSVLIFSHNTRDALRGCLEALERSKSAPETEVLVVDSGSTDGSATLDADFPWVTMLRLPLHAGATKAINIGTRTAKADYLFLMDTIVRVEPDTVSKLAAHLDADPEAYAVCPLLMEDGEPASRPMKLPSRETLRAAVRGVPLPAMDLDLSASVVDVDYPGRTALMIRREFITGMNYIDKRYGHYWGDAELAVQIRRANKKIRLLTMIRAHLQDSGSTGSWRDDPVLAADYINGAVELAGKHFGGGVKLSAVLWTLGEALKSPFSGFAWTRFLRVLSGEKIDSGLK